MSDREKVIKGLEWILEGDRFGFGVNWDKDCEPKSEEEQAGINIQNAIAVLKWQEAVKPRRIDGKRNHFIKCGNCNYDLVTGFQFCPHCGHEVKWNGTD